MGLSACGYSMLQLTPYMYISDSLTGVSIHTKRPRVRQPHDALNVHIQPKKKIEKPRVETHILTRQPGLAAGI